MKKLMAKKSVATIEECKLLAAKAGIPVTEGEKFFYFYESKGWKVGKSPMRSVGGAMGGWACRWREQNAKECAKHTPEAWQPGSGNL
jgi:hypothetical protein